MGSISRSVRDRLEAYSLPEPNSGCWLWERNERRGYGRMRVAGQLQDAHRASWEEHRGAIPAGMNVLHRCDTPACINPDHLFLGTQADNVRDRDAKGRRTAPRGINNNKAKLTDEQVRDIRASGLGTVALGRMYGVHRDTIGLIRSCKTWKHI